MQSTFNLGSCLLQVRVSCLICPCEELRALQSKNKSCWAFPQHPALAAVPGRSAAGSFQLGLAKQLTSALQRGCCAHGPARPRRRPHSECPSAWLLRPWPCQTQETTPFRCVQDNDMFSSFLP
eukprot:scaffold32108_cov17-Tisochrysis_lutea.AAC.2